MELEKALHINFYFNNLALKKKKKRILSQKLQITFSSIFLLTQIQTIHLRHLKLEKLQSYFKELPLMVFPVKRTFSCPSWGVK